MSRSGPLLRMNRFYFALGEPTLLGNRRALGTFRQERLRPTTTARQERPHEENEMTLRKTGLTAAAAILLIGGATIASAQTTSAPSAAGSAATTPSATPSTGATGSMDSSATTSTDLATQCADAKFAK